MIGEFPPFPISPSLGSGPGDEIVSLLFLHWFTGQDGSQNGFMAASWQAYPE
jgi:hypothetical protein